MGVFMNNNERWLKNYELAKKYKTYDIAVVCKSVSKEQKAQLLVKLSEWFEEKEKLTAKIKDLLECDDNGGRTSGSLEVTSAVKILFSVGNSLFIM